MSTAAIATQRRTGAAVTALCAGAAGLVLMSGSAGAAAVSNHTRLLAAGAQTRASGWSSSNWSGYAITGGPFTSITGHWTVPKVAASSGATYSSSWIGIDGFNDTSLIQTGTEQDYFNGAAHYDAWWEILPAPETVITGLTVHPGDHMTASITQGANSMWSIQISDTTDHLSFTTTQLYTGPLTSAEWIQEAPSVNGTTANLAHYGKVTFDPGTVNGHSPALVAADGGVMIQGARQVSTPSNPDSDTDGFRAGYGSAIPTPPKS